MDWRTILSRRPMLTIFTNPFEQLWLPSTWSARFGSAWPKLPGETAQPAVAAARYGDAVHAVPSDCVTFSDA